MTATEGQPWLQGVVATPLGNVPRVVTQLTWQDHLGAVRVRCAVGRMDYRVEPGLYAAGQPNETSQVFVSANYKLSFDHLRGSLAGIDGWILVLDTDGINVWCAAGKGTFGTDELVRRVETVGLARVVTHRRLIVPQLGASGVAAHEVRERSGFSVVYGPVRAADIPAFVRNGMAATAEMRRVQFGLWDRLVLVPVELVCWWRWLGWLLLALLVAGGVSRVGGYDVRQALELAPRTVLLAAACYVGAAIAVPALLPWLPGRAFAVKGAAAGVLIWGLFAAGLNGWAVRDAAAWCFIMVTMASFLGLQFTGATTFTSESGVRREMRLAMPCQIAALAVGVGLFVVARLLGG